MSRGLVVWITAVGQSFTSKPKVRSASFFLKKNNIFKYIYSLLFFFNIYILSLSGPTHKRPERVLYMYFLHILSLSLPTQSSGAHRFFKYMYIKLGLTRTHGTAPPLPPPPPPIQSHPNTHPPTLHTQHTRTHILSLSLCPPPLSLTHTHTHHGGSRVCDG